MQKSLDLFPDQPASATGSMMAVVTKPGNKLSPAQRTFEQLVANIEAAENRLREITSLLDMFRPKFINKMRPLYDERDLLAREMVIFLDEELLKKGWTSNQRSTMQSMVCTLAEQQFGRTQDDEMEAIFDRHSNVAAADLAAGASADLEAELEELFGIKPAGSGGEARSPAEVFQDAFSQLEQREYENIEQEKASAACRRRGKGSARQRKEEQQALDAGKLLKEIYRKLTSALHPDREPDVAERARKTALMSEVNKAYESANLLKLLQMQFQTFKVDSISAATLADEKLVLINRAFKQQYQELQMECQQLEMVVREEFNLEQFGALTAAFIQKALNLAAADERAFIKTMRRDLAAIRMSDNQLKNWLKVQRQLMNEAEAFEAAFDQVLFNSIHRRR